MAKNMELRSAYAVVLGVILVACGGAATDENNEIKNTTVGGTSGSSVGTGGAVVATAGAPSLPDSPDSPSQAAPSSGMAGAPPTVTNSEPKGSGGGYGTAVGGIVGGASPATVSGKGATSSVAGGSPSVAPAATATGSGATPSSYTTSRPINGSGSAPTVAAGGSPVSAGGAAPSASSGGAAMTAVGTSEPSSAGGAIGATSVVIISKSGAPSIYYGPGIGPDGKPLYPTGDPAIQPLPPPVSGAPATTITKVTELQLQAGTITCNCEAQMYAGDPMYYGPWGDINQCARYRYSYDSGGEPPPVIKCINDILATTSAGDKRIQCQEQAFSELAKCLNAVACDQNRAMRCEQYFYESVQTCPYYAYDLDAKIQLECWGNQLSPPFVCDDGTRMRTDVVCNGRKDCTGGEDEQSKYCSNGGKYPSTGTGTIVTCPDGSNLFDSSGLCNGMQECKDGWDEKPETCEAQGIKIFACPSGGAIQAGWVCDGVPDCPKKEDEANCPAAS